MIAMCLGQALHAQQFHFKKFGLADGIPQSQVYDILNDSRGFLWLGSRGGGISRYDGKSFKNYQTSHGLINNFVNCLYEDSHRDLWIGTQTGASKFDGLRFTSFPFSKKGEIRVFSIIEIDDKMLFGTSQGTFLLEGDSVRSLPIGHEQISNFYVHAFWVSKDHLYVGTNRGLFKLDRHELDLVKHFTKSNGLPDNYIQTIASISDSSCWIGTYGRGLRLFQNDKIIKPSFSLPAGLIIYDLMVADKNVLWVASQKNGAFQIEIPSGRITNYTERKGLSNNHVRCITTDRWGSVWLGTSGGGLNQFTGQLFSNYTKSDGLSDNYIYSIGQDIDGSIWVGNGNKGVSRLDSLGAQNFSDSIWHNTKVKAMAQSTDSSWWFGTEGQGILHKINEEVTSISTKNGLCGDYVKDIEIASNGHVFVATLDGGISEIEIVKGGLKFSNYRYLTELPSNRIFCLHVDARGRCWFGTENKGLGYIEKGVVHMTINDQDIKYQAIRAIRTSGNGQIWMATSSGLFSYNIADEKLLERGGGVLRSSNLYLLEFDLNGKLYVGHERGLDVLIMNEAGEIIDAEFYGASDGFEGIETCQNSVIRDMDGFLWFGTVNGLSRYNPNRSETPMRPPSIWLENIDLFYEKMQAGTYGYMPVNWDSSSGIPTFPYDKNHFGFSLSGIHLTQSPQIQYQWRLEGYDEKWAPVTDKSDATYSNLPPGTYTFNYRAMTSQEHMSSVKTWPFIIEAPYWQLWWFKSALGIVIASILLLSILLYLRRLKKQRQQLQFEKDLIELEQKALRLQMNPHFLFNALNSIQSLVAQDNTKEARNYLQKFAKLMRLTLQNSRLERIKLIDEINTLENYLSLEKLTRQPSFSFEIKCAEGTEPEEISIPPMMLQPFVENAIKHGVADMGEKGKIEITFELRDNWLHTRIRDNGIGREAAAEKQRSKSKSHESAAIQVITDRLQLLNKELTGNSVVMEDIRSNSKVVGTLVEIVLHAW